MSGRKMDKLEDFLCYDPSSPTGLRWIKRPSRNKQTGSVAMDSIRDGYYSGEFRGKNYRAHRVVYYLIYGTWPEKIDHIDGNRVNNLRENLRPATASTNQHNRIGRGTQCRHGKWQAKITVGGRSVALGTYDTEQAAHEAYLKAKWGLHPTAPERCYASTRGMVTPSQAISSGAEAQNTT